MLVAPAHSVSTLSIVDSVLLCFAAFSVFLFLKAWRNNTLSLPPGPKGLPLVGNVLDIPISSAWLTFTKWRQSFGDLVHLKVLGKSIMVIQSSEVAHDLLERRGALYSDRAQTVMIHELGGWDFAIGFISYTAEFKRRRQLFVRQFTTTAVRQYDGVIRKQVYALAGSLIRSPLEFYELLESMTIKTIVEIAYGHEVRSQDDPVVQSVLPALRYIDEVAIPPGYIVDQIPWLKYLPSWLPGTSFKRRAAEGLEATTRMWNIPFQLVKKRFDEGLAQPSFTSRQLEALKNKTSNYDEETIAKVAGIIYAAGVETVLSHTRSFVLAMVLYPEVQHAAQQELDRICGDIMAGSSDCRLPEPTDAPRLPYVGAIVTESLRWIPAAPLGIPHSVAADDEYKGYRIPKGTIFIPNIWGMLHDHEVYKDPFEFDPMRYLDPDRPAKDPRSTLFGFGRRICPGRHFAERELWMAIATLLYLFKFEKVVDDSGIPIEPETAITELLVVQPKPFPASIRPRSVYATAVLNGVLADSQ